ncbi:MAG: hypothetical protein IIA87_03705 [Nanoarchaeota archaeon]|nr:hypothetical protein [Nanoarchaeota archaeon]
MKFKEKTKITGRVRIENVTTGEIREVNNSLVNIGFDTLSALTLSDVGGTAFDFLALGTGSSTIIATNTLLDTETLRIASTGTQQTTNVANDTARFIGSFTGDTTETINEIGIFNITTANTGSMLARAVFADLNVITNDKINVTYNIVFA